MEIKSIAADRFNWTTFVEALCFLKDRWEHMYICMFIMIDQKVDLEFFFNLGRF